MRSQACTAGARVPHLLWLGIVSFSTGSFLLLAMYWRARLGVITVTAQNAIIRTTDEQYNTVCMRRRASNAKPS